MRAVPLEISPDAHVSGNCILIGYSVSRENGATFIVSTRSQMSTDLNDFFTLLF